MMHELTYASAQGLLGSIDANRGDLLLGWDTDQFPTDLYLTTQCMLVILGQGGLAPGGVNFDAKVRRESFEPVDLFHAHIGGMDAFAHGPEDRRQDPRGRRAEGLRQAALRLVGQRHRPEDRERARRASRNWRTYMLEKGDAAANVSGRQEMLENIVNRYLR